MHTFTLRVYYEDTDLAGIVYYANYLKFIERARSEWVRGLGIDQALLRAKQGIVFAVRRVEADYLRPAVFDDVLSVQTTLADHSGARLVLDLKCRLPSPPCPPCARVTRSPSCARSNRISPVSASLTTVPTGMRSSISAAARP